MKTTRNPNTVPGLPALAGGVALFTGALQAAPFLYAPGDLLLSFRQEGAASDYVVNIGKSASFSTLPSGSNITIANISLEQLGAAFPSLNGLAWSVSGANRPPKVPEFPLQTIWATSPRLDPGVPGAPWLRKGQYAQGSAASQIDALGNAATASSSSQAAGPGNTSTGVIIPVSTDFTIGPVLGPGGDYVGTFQGSVEGITADDFDGDPSNVSRADLYELEPGASADATLNSLGRRLGYFELKPDGSLTFNTGTTPLPAPSITGIQRANNTTIVSFTTIENASYWLHASNVLGAPFNAWSVVSGPITGTGAILSLEETSTDPSRFFAVEVQP